MAAAPRSRLGVLLQKYENEVLTQWLATQSAATTLRPDLLSAEDLGDHSRRFLGLLARGLAQGGVDPTGSAFAEARTFLEELSRSRARAGFSPTETATFVFSLKEPLFAVVRREFARDPDALAEETWALTLLLDRLGLYTTEIYQKSREEIIARQQRELLELSTPVVQLWQGVLALPLIGTLDSSRTQVVMESLLQEIVRTGASVAIIDITGVPTVDTLVAQHLLKTVAAARLMGADCIISGIRAQIAQTIVHLGVDLEDVITKSSLADAFSIALRRNGLAVGRAAMVNGAGGMGGGGVFGRPAGGAGAGGGGAGSAGAAEGGA